MGVVCRLKATLVYDGTHFSGYQVQPNKRTVQEEVEAAVAKVHKAKTWPTVASGRTDAGVHSFGQTIHFDIWKYAEWTRRSAGKPPLMRSSK